MMDIKLVVFIRGKRPRRRLFKWQKKKDSNHDHERPMFIACGKLYSAGITERGVWIE